ncbi:hypothetical protein, partial [Tatumella sp. JGM130]|uniref:hypothetical protein n=1 Tax=Tatumella sp. JGM130 TaxID=2799797 RepID=UPI001BB07A16
MSDDETGSEIRRRVYSGEYSRIRRVCHKKAVIREIHHRDAVILYRRILKNQCKKAIRQDGLFVLLDAWQFPTL